MKIVQLVNSRRRRGAEIFAGQLSRDLCAFGNEVHYVSLYKEVGPLLEIQSGIIIDLDGTRSASPDPFLVIRLCRVLMKVRPDVVQANAGDTLKYAVIARFLIRGKFKLVFRNASLISRYLRSGWSKWFTGFLLRQTDAILSVSEASRGDTLELFPALDGRTSVLPVGVDLQTCSKDVRITGPGPHLVHVGGFSFEKNHQGLLRIFARINQRIPAAHLWLAGDGPLIERMKEMSVHMGISGSLTFLGSVEEPLNIIHAADVLLLPSLIEGMPAVLLEAFWCGTPVVASRVGGIPEIVDHGVTGWLEDPADEQAFADRVIAVLNHSEERQMMIMKARERVDGQYDNRKIAARFLEVYCRLNNSATGQ